MIKLEYANKIQEQESKAMGNMMRQFSLALISKSLSKVQMLMSRYNYWQAQYRAYLGNKCITEHERKTNLKCINMCRRSAQNALNELKQYKK